MAWPNISDFGDAVQHPERCFEDRELAGGNVVLNPRGLPLVYSGAFACVYQVIAGADSYAVRCFTREVNDQHSRYDHLDRYLAGVRPDAFVRFQYLERGVMVRGMPYPVVKMSWVQGDRLDRFAKENLDAPERLQDLAARWRGVNASLRGLGIAHNDLQHGNAIVQPDGAIRLVDYDGIFLPEFRGQPSPELGHRHYQHPARKTDDYHHDIDNFPTLVVYLSLLALAQEPGLWGRFNNEDNLVFTRDDFADPANSHCFRALKNCPDAQVAELTALLEKYCSIPVEQVPDLETILRGVPPPSRPNTARRPAQPTATPQRPSPAPAGGASQFRQMLQNNEAPQPGNRGATPPGVQTGARPSNAQPTTPPNVQGGASPRTAQPTTPPNVQTRATPSNARPATPPSVQTGARPNRVQPATPPSVQTGPAARAVKCSGCGQVNSHDLIYCSNESCATVLQPGALNCPACRHYRPVNAVFCPDCGVNIKTGGRICSQCRAQIPPNATRCRQCGMSLTHP